MILMGANENSQLDAPKLSKSSQRSKIEQNTNKEFDDTANGNSGSELVQVVPVKFAMEKMKEYKKNKGMADKDLKIIWFFVLIVLNNIQI